MCALLVQVVIAQEVAGLYRTRHFFTSTIDLKPNGEYVYSNVDCFGKMYHDFGTWTVTKDTVYTSTENGSVKRKLLLITTNNIPGYKSGSLYHIYPKNDSIGKLEYVPNEEWYAIKRYYPDGSTKSIVTDKDGTLTEITYYQGGALKEFATMDDKFSIVYDYDVNGVLQNVVREKRSKPKRR